MTQQERLEQQGVVYELTGERERGRVAGYHRKPNPQYKHKTPFPIDVKGMKKKDRQNILTRWDGMTSRFTVGFEIEKNSLHRGAVREYELFCGFETDSSCGYEAVTHILPLLPPSGWRNKVFDMMVKANKIIDDNFSPSSDNCGGHITIGVEGEFGDDIMEKMRCFSGIVLAIYRKRLKNTYCGQNPRMRMASEGGTSAKYQVAYSKGRVLEFRIPPRVQNVKQLMRRYELFYEICDVAYNSPDLKFKSFLKRIDPILKSMYDGDAEKVKEIKRLAELFQDFIDSATIHPDIRAYIPMFY